MRTIRVITDHVGEKPAVEILALRQISAVSASLQILYSCPSEESPPIGEPDILDCLVSYVTHTPFRVGDYKIARVD